MASDEPRMVITLASGPARRQCGSCTLCCRLVPVRELNKLAGERCRHQRHTGCAIYARRPHACQLWSCRWLVADDVEGIRRPDRAGYVIDIMPDFVKVDDQTIQVVQVWIDDKRPLKWRDDPAFIAYCERRAAEGLPVLARLHNDGAVAIFPPAISADGQWHFVQSNVNFDLKPEENWQMEKRNARPSSQP